MITVPVHKDVYGYEPKIVWMLTQRTLIFTGVACALGLAVGACLLFLLHLPTRLMMYVVVALTLPIWYLGFARPCKMRPEQLAPFWLRHTFMPQEVHYSTSNVSNNTVDRSMFGSDVVRERYNPDVQPPLQRHYEKLRRQSGIEAWEPTSSVRLP